MPALPVEFDVLFVSQCLKHKLHCEDFCVINRDATSIAIESYFLRLLR